MQNLINKIHLGDCLEFMKQLPDKCIALVLTDPPYGNGNGVAQAHYDQYGDEWARLCRRAKRMQLSYSR